jgi:type IV pilus assembly protein PilA
MPILSPMRRPYVLCLRAAAAGFTMIELMVVVGIVAVLALIAVPGISDKMVREQIVEAAKLIEIAKPPVQASWATLATMPVDNAAAGLPAATSIVNNYVSSVAIESGAIQVTFGNRASSAISGKTLSFRPGVVEASPIVPITWVCGHAGPPVPMNARGLDKTTIADRYLPLNCRAAPASGPAP